MTSWSGPPSTQGFPRHSETPCPYHKNPKTRALRAQFAALRTETRTQHSQSTSFSVVGAFTLQLPLLALAWGAQPGVLICVLSTQNRLMGKSESPVEMVERSDRSGKKPEGFLVWGLMLLLLLLLGALVALGVLFGRGE